MSFYKTGVVSANSVLDALRCPFDKQVYLEPDGSAWIRIVHHNNPAAARFASTDPFETLVYKDADRWFAAALCNSVTRWELMIVQAVNSGDTASKFRWIQTVNPMAAVFADVSAANVTKITTTGYTTPSASYGGIYKFNTKDTFFVCNNGSSGNWWGAFGSWTDYQGGIPGYNQVVVKSGYMDLYLRLDGVSAVDRASVYEDKITTDTLIEV